MNTKIIRERELINIEEFDSGHMICYNNGVRINLD